MIREGWSETDGVGEVKKEGSRERDGGRGMEREGWKGWLKRRRSAEEEGVVEIDLHGMIMIEDHRWYKILVSHQRL